MRVAVIGGTEFIGPAIVEELLAGRHEVTVVHRGLHEPAGLPEVPHVHCDRRDGAALRQVLREVVRAEAVIDTCAYAQADAEALVGAPRPGARLVVLSSMDVYRAYGSILEGIETDPMPLDEDAPLRAARYLQRGKPAPLLRGADPETYEKIDVEAVARRAGALILRLPVVFGPRDPLRREEPILRRARAGRRRIPFGGGRLGRGAGARARRALAARPVAQRHLQAAPDRRVQPRAAPARLARDRLRRGGARVGRVAPGPSAGGRQLRLRGRR